MSGIDFIDTACDWSKYTTHDEDEQNDQEPKLERSAKPYGQYLAIFLQKKFFTIITITICKHNHEYIIIAIITMYDQNSHIIDI